ncbi:MAG: hypothetical protein JWM27_3773 [Gemmatimonadetes bacterium]|nr:hypothetical protein [Gemmatimonadota bacterium]
MLEARFRTDAAEHERAGNLIRGRAEGSFSLLPMIPFWMALSVLSFAIQFAASARELRAYELAVYAEWILVFAGTFCMGVGLAMRRQGELTWRVSADGIAIHRPRRPLHVPWGRIVAVDETPEFFLVRLTTVGFYLPKRVLGDSGGEGAWRTALMERAGPASNINVSG